MSSPLFTTFFAFSGSFFNKDTYSPSDLLLLEGFNPSVLLYLAKNGLFSMFKEFKEFRELVCFSKVQNTKDQKYLAVLFPTQVYFGSVKALGDLYLLEERNEPLFFRELRDFTFFQEFLGLVKSPVRQEFKEFKELSFLSYYFDFKLLLCSECSLAINPTNLKGHLGKHFRHQKGRARQDLVSKALSFLGKLEVRSLKESYFLLSLYMLSFQFSPFKELRLRDNLFRCLASPSCSITKTTEYYIKRHLRDEHSPSGGYEGLWLVIRKFQSLEETRFFLPILPPSRGKEAEVTSTISSDIVEGLDRAPTLLEEPTAKEQDPFTKASNSFLKKFKVREQAFKKDLVSSLGKGEKLSNFQVKTRYLDFLKNKDKKLVLTLFSPIQESEDILRVLSNTLKEILYISLEQSLFLNKVHLNVLNSFQPNVTTNKGFKPLLNSQSRLRYFSFFSSFLVFLLRCYRGPEYKRLGLLYLPSLVVECLEQLITLGEQLALEEDEDQTSFNSKKHLRKVVKLSSSRLNKQKAKHLEFLEESEDEGEGESEGEREDEDLTTSSASSLSSKSSSLLSADSSKSGDSEGSEDSLNSLSSRKVREKVGGFYKGSSSTIIQTRDCLLRVFDLLFRQEIELNLFKSPINAFFACKGIKADLSFRDAREYSGFFSQFIYCSQLVIIYNGMNSLVKEREFSLLPFFQEYMSFYFNNASPFPLGELLNNRSYCFKILKETSSLSSLIINKKEGVVSYKKVSVSIADLRGLFKEVISEGNKVLRDELLFAIPSRKYKYVSLEEFSKVEDLDETKPFSCFKDFHPRVNESDLFLMSHILNTPSLRAKFFKASESGELEFKKAEVKAYLDSVKGFLKLGLLIVYLTSGLPLRGTEVVTLRFLNSFRGKREMFLDRASNLFILNISYFKGKEYKEKEGANIRYLSKVASELFLLYIVLVYPFVQQLYIAISSQRSYSNLASLSSYLFFINKDFLTSRDLSLSLRTISATLLGQRLNIQVYRQVIVAVIREFMDESLDEKTLTLAEALSKGSAREIGAAQMNHSLRTEGLHYGRSVNTISNVREGIQQRYLEFCLRFFAFFSLDELDLSPLPLVVLLGQKDKIESQAKELERARPALRFSKSTSLSSLSQSSLGKHSRARSSIGSSIDNLEVKRVRLEELYSLSSSPMLSERVLTQLLREFLGDREAVFRSQEQRFLVEAILLKVPFILAVLPTSSGKSLSYLLTSSLSNSSITLVIVPLVGLKQDLLRRAKEFNIPSLYYEDERDFEVLTLVSIETLVDDDFFFSVRQLVEAGRLDRVIVDECHLLISASEYRPIMKRFYEFLHLSTQFVFLTGTLPLSFEQELRGSLKLEDLSIIRAPSSRGDISYKALALSSRTREGQLNEVVGYIQTFLRTLSSCSEKVLVFCPSVKAVLELGEALGALVYYSSLPNKTDVLNTFLRTSSPASQVLVGTSGLQEGIDYPSIRLVVYFEFAYSFLGFLQGSSRGGRDQKGAESVFFYRSFDLGEKENESLDVSSVRKYLREVVCRRRVIYDFLDSSLYNECSKDEQPCDLCLSRRKALVSSSARSLVKTREIELARAELKELARSMSYFCSICLDDVRRGRESLGEARHSFKGCEYNEEVPFSSSSAIIDRLRDDPFVFIQDSCCFSCFLPTTICGSLRVEKEGELVCFNKVFVIEFWSFVYSDRYHEELCDFLAEFNLGLSETDSLEVFLKSCFKKSRLEEANTESINGMKAFFKFARYALKKTN